MKKLILFYTVLIIFSLTIPSVGQGITGSSHDFSGQSWAPAANAKCAVCHATHHAKVVDNVPLWNHQSTIATFQTYVSPTLNATVLSPSASSKLCLSCHDGTVAVENFGNNTSGTHFLDVASGVQIGGSGDLRRDHPISFEYTSALATADGGGLKDPSSATVTIAGLTGTIKDKMLFADKLECASCHDVHNKLGNPSLLRMSNTTSQLCLACHIK